MTITLILETKVPVAVFFVAACYAASAEVLNLVPRFSLIPVSPSLFLASWDMQERTLGTRLQFAWALHLKRFQALLALVEHLNVFDIYHVSIVSIGPLLHELWSLLRENLYVVRCLYMQIEKIRQFENAKQYFKVIKTQRSLMKVAPLGRICGLRTSLPSEFPEPLTPLP